MAVDGCFLHCLIRELSSAIGSRVDKIYQPSRDELVLLLRAKDFNRRLYICASPSSPRINFTVTAIENPAQPPMLCMLMRKHLVGAKLVGITQLGLDRVVSFEFEGINEMGDTVRPRITAELIGQACNIILVGPDGRIIDAVHRSDIERGDRMIQPGAAYTPPDGRSKLSLLTLGADRIAGAVDAVAEAPEKALLDTVDGLSPLVCRELCTQKKTTAERLRYILEALDSGGVPYLAQGDNVCEFSYIPIEQYGTSATLKRFDSFSEMLDTVYTERAARERIARASRELTKLVSGIEQRIVRKTANRKNELRDCADREKYRVFGELIKANIHGITPGASEVTVKNYYADDLGEITIPLNGTLSPAANAAAYFKEYKKLCGAERLLGQLIADGESELSYIRSVKEALGRAETVSDISEIREELESAGYVRRPRQAVKKRTPLCPREYTSPDGFRVLVGRNNRQNELLTFKTAAKNDIWLHVKDYPGAHVLIVTDGGQVPESTLIFAAKLAVANTTRTASSASVAVDYTEARRVKKIPGANPGMVTYTNQRTLYVTP